MGGERKFNRGAERVLLVDTYVFGVPGTFGGMGFWVPSSVRQAALVEWEQSGEAATQIMDASASGQVNKMKE